MKKRRAQSCNDHSSHSPYADADNRGQSKSAPGCEDGRPSRPQGTLRVEDAARCAREDEDEERLPRDGTGGSRRAPRGRTPPGKPPNEALHDALGEDGNGPHPRAATSDGHQLVDVHRHVDGARAELWLAPAAARCALRGRGTSPASGRNFFMWDGPRWRVRDARGRGTLSTQRPLLTRAWSAPHSQARKMCSSGSIHLARWRMSRTIWLQLSLLPSSCRLPQPSMTPTPSEGASTAAAPTPGANGGGWSSGMSVQRCVLW